MANFTRIDFGHLSLSQLALLKPVQAEINSRSNVNSAADKQNQILWYWFQLVQVAGINLSGGARIEVFFA